MENSEQLVKMEMLEDKRPYEIEEIKNYAQLLEKQYEHAIKGEIEWIGCNDLEDEKKDKDDDGDSQLYALLAKRKGDEYKIMYYSYDKHPLMQIDYTIRSHNKYVTKPVESRISQIKEKLMKDVLDHMEEFQI